MFSVSDIKEDVYPAVYRRGKELYETGGVLDFAYDIYLEHDLPVAEVRAEVRGKEQSSYRVTAVVDEEYGTVSSSNCTCEAFYNYEGMCKHCVAALLAYVNRRQAKDILAAKRTGHEAGEQGSAAEEKPVAPMQTAGAFKTLLNQYSLRAGVSYLIPESVYGKVELEPYFKLDYSYATVEFKIGMEQKYVLKNISAFLHSIERNEKVHYGKKLDFYHNRQAFTEDAWRMVEFMRMQDDDKKRQSRFHAYYAYTGGYERTMELDEVGIDRFFDAIGEMPLSAEIGYLPEEEYHVQEGERKPKLEIRAGASGVFVLLEDLQVIRGSRFYYFYEDGMIYRSSEALKAKTGDFFDYMERQAGGECYIAADELPSFCRDLLPLLRETFRVTAEGFDETLYVPKKPEFELYLDKQDNQTVGAKLVAAYGDDKYNVLQKIEPGEVRDLGEEMRVRTLVEPYFNEYGLGQTIFILSHNEDMLYQLISSGLQRLSEYMSIYTTEDFRGMKVVSSPSVSVGVALKSDLLELQIHSDEMSREELAYLLTRYDRKKKYVRLKNGDFLDVREDGLGLLAEISEDLRLTESGLKKGHVNVPKYRAMYLDAALKSNQELSVEKNREFKGMVRNMKTIEDSDYEVPDSLRSIMRGYQKSGFLWLKTLRENGFGGILADDMGLGKTLQVISLLLSEQESAKAGERECHRSLIVCPASLVYNWQKEISRFAPQIKTTLVTGLAAERQRIVRHTKEGEVLITSYDLLKRDVELYRDMVFAIQVIDEAQYIKNPGTQAAKGVKQITAGFKLALTGTPIENRLSELWSIFDYLMPGFLYKYETFKKSFETPIVKNKDMAASERLRQMTAPFILRRLKKDVLRDLPEKLEEVRYAKPEKKQLDLYNGQLVHMQKLLKNQNEDDFNKNKLKVLAELTRIRQICCDPSLCFEDYNGGSAKREACMELIASAAESGHKMLVFSQFTSMLELLEKDLKASGLSWYKITGSTPKEERIRLVKAFNEDSVPVFLISLKAGGTGLNLTGADIVIHYDPWWNLAVQNQATDRAHRLGQTKTVTVYKLIMKDSIEEKILKLQEAKKDLADEILKGENGNLGSLSQEELRELIG